MRKIWKYEIPLVTDRPGIEMPHGAEILTVQMQRDVPMLWAIVDSSAPKVNRQFLIIGTGHRVPDDVYGVRPSLGRYVGTWQQHQGALVLHLFDLGIDIAR